MRGALLGALVLTAQGCATANAETFATPERVSAEQVLPGFEPLRRTGNQVDLYARQIRWNGGLLPDAFDALSSRLADVSLVITDARGRDTVLAADGLQWLSTSPTRAEYEASTRFESLVVHLRAAVEYDGVVDITMSLTPSSPVEIRGLRVESRVHTTDYSEVLGFRAEGIRKQKDRKDFLSLPYRGEFVHAVTVADGNRSFWWFADNNRGWKRAGNAPVTEVLKGADHITIRQHVVAGRQRLRQPTQLRFGLLATPVRPIEPERRVRHATAKGHSRKERDMGTAYKIWWPTALAYDAYPYTSYADDRASRLEPSERK
ncbi:MAG: glycoside hydrolase domain-containing protein, partial [Pseudomonadota bacterium]